VNAESASGNSPIRALRTRRGEQPRVPDKRDGDRSPVEKVNDKRVVREVNVLDTFTWLDV
jgi:hypothetical protein